MLKNKIVDQEVKKQKMMWILDESSDEGISWINPDHIKRIKCGDIPNQTDYTIEMIDGEVIDKVISFHIGYFESRDELHRIQAYGLGSRKED